MRVLVTGASGWIGSAVVPELIDAGHQVVGLARSDASAARITDLGAEVQRGSIDDTAGIATAAAAVDGVVHLAYHHDFTEMGRAAAIDRAVIDAVGDTYAGSNRPLLIANGVLGLEPGRIGTEDDQPVPDSHPRTANAAATLALADRGVRSIVMRYAATVHGPGDHGFTARLVEIARERGASGYVGDGANRWPAVHRLDAGHLTRLAFDQAEAGAIAHAVAENVPTREIAEAIGAGLGLPVVSVDPADAEDHFGWLGMFFAMDSPASHELTTERYGWHPTHPTLADDLASGAYFG